MTTTAIPLSQGATIDLTIERPAVGGRMIARHEGRIVLVSGAIPGERVRARVVGFRRDVPLVATEHVLVPDPDRRPADADPACGGNVFAHVAYTRQLALKREIVADAFVRIGRLPAPASIAIAPSPERGYRMRTRLHVAGAQLGFLEAGSHRLCDAVATGQLTVDTARVLDGLGRALEAGGADGVREVEIVESVAGDQRLVHLWLDRNRATIPEAAAGLVSVTGVTGVSAAVSRTDPVTVVAGDAEIADPLSVAVPTLREPGTAVVRRRAAAFFQANRHLLGALVARVLDALPDDPVVDLYAGVGLFAVAAAADGHSDVTAVEGDPISGEDLANNAARVGAGVRAVRRSVERYLREVRHPARGAWIVDPPRTGLSRDARTRVAACGPPRLVYVSCDLATLARDLRVLIDAGYALRAIEGFDLFPRTAHLELVAVLER